MAVAYVKALVQLNLGADDAAFDQSIEVKEDEGVNAGESYFKFGDAALKHIFDDSTTSGALFFFWAPHHGDENAADVLHARRRHAAGGHNRGPSTLKLDKVPWKFSYGTDGPSAVRRRVRGGRSVGHGRFPWWSVFTSI